MSGPGELERELRFEASLFRPNSKTARLAIKAADAIAASQDRVRVLEALVRDQISAASDMLTGVEVHNRLNPDAGARRADISGPVVTTLANVTHRARQALAPTITGRSTDAEGCGKGGVL